jgi:hypothetical protein
MNKEFVEYEEALALKELGFDKPCFGYYVDGELRGINLGMEELGGVEPYYQRFGFHTLSNHDIDNPNKIVVTAPTFSQAFTWFRENHGLYHYILPEFYKNGINFNWQILWYLPKEEWTNHRIYNGTMLYGDNGEYPTQEEADIACLKKLIEIVKNK